MHQQQTGGHSGVCCGAQIFDAVGLSSNVVEKFFTGTATRIEGVNLKEIQSERFP